MFNGDMYKYRQRWDRDNPNKSGQRKHIIPKRYNGIAVHRKNYWSKTTKYPQEENK